VAKRGPAGRDGDEPRDADPGAPGAPGAGGGDRVTAAADELYGADPGEFTDRRKALADAARAAGDTAAAKRIAALRKPTRAAWVVNSLARADPDAPDRLAGLAAALRAAEQAKDGRRLRELSGERGPLVDALTAEALAAAGVPDPPSGLREEVTATLTSAIADPAVAAEFASGRLTRAAQWAGFGLASFGETPFGDALGDAPATDKGAPTRRHLRAVPSAEVSAPGPAQARARSRRAVPARVSEEEQARRAEAAEQRLAEEAAQRAAQRRQAFEDAERTVASTAAAAAEAGSAEDQLEAEVRDLEQRLTQARENLAGTRMRARRAESAARRARQALDQLPRP
jgi:hypothetical protein